LLNHAGKLIICKRDDVPELWDSGESAGKDGSGEGVNFADANRFDSCSFKSKVKPSNSAKE
jgi:hypothetical protein